MTLHAKLRKFIKQNPLLKAVNQGTFLKFALVGISGVIINNGILLLLTQTGTTALTAAIISTECAIITNFIGNSLWTWGGHGMSGWQERFLYFQGISLIAGAMTVMLFWWFHTYLAMPLLIANTIAIFITFIVNYMLNKKITWATPKSMRVRS